MEDALLKETIKEINGYKVIEYKEANVFIIENIFEDDLCDDLIKLQHTLPSTKQLYSNINNVECYISSVNNFLDVDDTYFYEFSTNPKVYENILNKLQKKELEYNNRLNGISNKKIKDYIHLFNKKTDIIKNIMTELNHKICFDFNSGFTLRKIFGPTRQHIDDITLEKSFNNTHFQMYRESREINMNTMIIRNVSAVFSLNDDYCGGIFSFPNSNISLKLKKGSVVLFPPYWTNRHETSELLNNTYRYTLNTWYGKILKKN
jgi:hypothetical protein